METAELPEYRADYRRHLRSRGLSTRTISDYLRSVDNLMEWLNEQNEDTITTGILKDYFADFLERPVNCHKSRHADPSGRTVSPTYVLRQYADLQQFFKWAVSEHLCVKTIWVGMVRPKVTRKAIPVISDEHIATLIKYVRNAERTGSLNAFLLARDEAMIRFFIDTGVRVGDLVSMTLDSIDFDSDTAIVVGKGSKERTVSFGDKTAIALRKFLRLRKTRRNAGLPELWTGRQSALTTQGVREVIERRCVEAGVPHINPHRFRHTTAHNWLDAGLGENSLAQLMGWSGTQMIRVYGASAASSRAVREHKRASLADRF